MNYLAFGLVGVLALAPGNIGLPWIYQGTLCHATSNACNCAASQDATASHASAKCTPPGQTEKDCFEFTATDPAGQPATTRGCCFIETMCNMRDCTFKGFHVRFQYAGCGTDCCAGTNGTVTIDWPDPSADEDLNAGGESSAKDITQPARACGTPNVVKQITVTCKSTGVVVFEVTITFRCGSCPGNPV